jgi:hypothetical protein
MVALWMFGIAALLYVVIHLVEQSAKRRNPLANIALSLKDLQPHPDHPGDMARMMAKIKAKQAAGLPVNVYLNSVEHRGRTVFDGSLSPSVKVSIPMLASAACGTVETLHGLKSDKYKILDQQSAGLTLDREYIAPKPTTIAGAKARRPVTFARTPTRGLVIGEEPLERILVGRKFMELRSSHNRQIGPIALIKKGSGRIYGVATITDSVGPMDFKTFVQNSPAHGVRKNRLQEVFDKNWRIGWRLDNVWRLVEPVVYAHRGMSRVTLDQDVIYALFTELQRATPVELNLTSEDFEASHGLVS